MTSGSDIRLAVAGCWRVEDFRGVWSAIDGSPVKKCAVYRSDVALSHGVVALSAKIVGG